MRRRRLHWKPLARGQYDGIATEADILDLLEKSNWDHSGSLLVPGDYLETVITKA